MIFRQCLICAIKSKEYILGTPCNDVRAHLVSMSSPPRGHLTKSTCTSSLEVGKPHGPVGDVVVDVAPLEKRLADEPIVPEGVGPVHRGGAVVAVAGKRQRRGQNVKVGAGKGEANGRRGAAVVVAREAGARGHGLDAGAREDVGDAVRGAEDDGRAGVGDDAGAVLDRRPVDRHVALDRPLALR